MPNHVHCIITITKQTGSDEAKNELSNIVRNLKAFTTHEFFAASNHRKLWQRGYYKHIVRDELELAKIDEYIKSNPSTRIRDKYYLI